PLPPTSALSLHDALPIYQLVEGLRPIAFQLDAVELGQLGDRGVPAEGELDGLGHRTRRLPWAEHAIHERPGAFPDHDEHDVAREDRKSTRLNSSHVKNSY